jgi:stringent starvation protein B
MNDLLDQQPYFMRAIYEWLCDNNYTPQVLLDCSFDGVQVPSEYIRDNKIIFIISEQATNNSLVISNEKISFKARIGEDFLEITAPVYAIMGIFAKEEPKVGLTFSMKPSKGSKETTKEKIKKNTTRKPNLKIV